MLMSVASAPKNSVFWRCVLVQRAQYWEQWSSRGSNPERGRSTVRADEVRNAAGELPRFDAPIDCMGGEGDL